MSGLRQNNLARSFRTVGGEIPLIRQIFPVFVGLALLATASSLLASLIGLQLSRRGIPGWELGLVAAGAAVGGILGANASEGVIQRAGHLRSFAALAAALACIVLMHALFTSPASWVLLRFATGFCYYGLVLIAESWLNKIADQRTRGRVLAAYMIVFFASSAIGQLLLNVRDTRSADLFIVAGMLLTISVVPLVLIRSREPESLATTRIPLNDLLHVTGISVIGAVSAGVIAGTYYALGAAFADQTGLSTTQVSLFMASVIAGGLVLQWPIGWLSDHLRRSVVIIGTAGSAGVCSILVAMSSGPNAIFYVAAFVFGGTAFSLYPLSLAQASDLFRREQIVGLNRSLLSVFAVGAAVGPLIGGFLISAFDPASVFLLMAVTAGTLSFCAVFARAVPQALKKAFVSVPLGSLGASSLDPRQTRRTNQAS